MAITRTIIVLGVLLHSMQCNANDATSPGSTQSPSVVPTALGSTKPTDPPTTKHSPTTIVLSTLLDTTKAATSPAQLETTKPALPPDSITPAAQTTTPAQTTTSLTSSQQETTMANQGPNPTSLTVPSTIQTTTITPTTSNASPATTASNNSPQNTPDPVITSNPNQGTTNSNRPTTTISTEDSTTQLRSTQTPAVTKTSPDSKSTDSQSVGTTEAQTTTTSNTASPINNKDTTISTSTRPPNFNNTFDLSSSTKVSIAQEAWKMLGQKMNGTCRVILKFQDKQLIATFTIDADQTINPESYKISEQPSGNTDNNTKDPNNKANTDTMPDTLIAILASCGALVLILCCFAAYCSYHRRSYRKNQQHLTEELQTVENGYHDNPTLEVMEVQPEMQEKKTTLNGEFNDSWIVPIDNLLKEDIPDEEDTHL
ncbi:podocalyxin [Garra rufa]|uniref:podocalyxin n=1 Tax=Garra rufa TaxID=137080 RepID=UPI003CCE795D